MRILWKFIHNQGFVKEFFESKIYLISIKNSITTAIFFTLTSKAKYFEDSLFESHLDASS